MLTNSYTRINANYHLDKVAYKISSLGLTKHISEQLQTTKNYTCVNDYPAGREACLLLRTSRTGVKLQIQSGKINKPS